MKEQSMAEWFDLQNEMIHFYERKEQYQLLVDSFTKLNSLYIAQIYHNSSLLEELQKEIVAVICESIPQDKAPSENIIKDLVTISNELICIDPLMESFSLKKTYQGEMLAILTHNTALKNYDWIDVEIYRPEHYVSLCHFHLMPFGKIDMSIKNFARFLEIGLHALRNKIRINLV